MILVRYFGVRWPHYMTKIIFVLVTYNQSAQKSSVWMCHWFSQTQIRIRVFSRRAYARVLRLSSVTLCIMAKRCVLSKSYYWQSIGSHIWETKCYQNEWPWRLFRGRFKVTSTTASHSPLNISETVTERLGSKRPPNKKQLGQWTKPSTDSSSSCHCQPLAVRQWSLSSNKW